LRAACLLKVLLVPITTACRQEIWPRVRKEMQDAPTPLASVGRIAAPADEPGEPLIINATILDNDTKAPIAGVVVYAYHTYKTGHCRNPVAPEWSARSTPRLLGWLKTDSRGHLEWQTIRPGPHPNRDVPAHIPVTARGAGYPVRWFRVEFAGDALLAKPHFTGDTAEFLYTAPLEQRRSKEGNRACMAWRMRSSKGSMHRLKRQVMPLWWGQLVQATGWPLPHFTSGTRA